VTWPMKSSPNGITAPAPPPQVLALSPLMLV
jgi:hypothetical protein